MKDVTKEVMTEVDGLEGEAKEKKIQENTDRILSDAKEDGKYKTSVKYIIKRMTHPMLLACAGENNILYRWF